MGYLPSAKTAIQMIVAGILGAYLYANDVMGIRTKIDSIGSKA